MVLDLHLTASSRLRGARQRYTPNRRAVVEVLGEASRPLTVNEILDVRRELPQSSVYRNLEILDRAGVIRKVSGGDEFTRFELAEDLVGHHHHLVCSNCGSLQDFDAPRQLERAVARTATLVAGRTGFGIRDHHLQLTGLCADCS